jgi:hypothetical protein
MSDCSNVHQLHPLRALLVTLACLVTLFGCAAQGPAGPGPQVTFKVAAAQCKETRIRTGGSWVSYVRCVYAAAGLQPGMTEQQAYSAVGRPESVEITTCGSRQPWTCKVWTFESASGLSYLQLFFDQINGVWQLSGWSVR